jgi:hypothetical protein
VPIDDVEGRLGDLLEARLGSPQRRIDVDQGLLRLGGEVFGADQPASAIDRDLAGDKDLAGAAGDRDVNKALRTGELGGVQKGAGDSTVSFGSP